MYIDNVVESERLIIATFFLSFHQSMCRGLMAASQPLIRLKQTKDLLASSSRNTATCNTSTQSSVCYHLNTLALTTNARPTTGRPPATNNGCVMWIHLQASICTEWAHSSMVVKSKSRVSSVREVRFRGEGGAFLKLVTLRFLRAAQP